MIGNPNTTSVRTTETSLRIVDVLLELESARFNEIAECLDIAPSTAHRHLRTLQKFGYIINESGQYRLGLRFLTIGGHVRNSRFSYDLAKDAVYELAQQTKERAQFEVEEQGERVFLFTRTGEHAVRADAKIGKRGPLHCSAAGKALLAELPDTRIHEIIDSQGLPMVTKNSINDSNDLFKELETIRETGVAFNHEESTLGLHAVACSITEPNGTVLGAISVSGPAHRIKGDRFNVELPDLVKGVSQELELNIKYSK